MLPEAFLDRMEKLLQEEYPAFLQSFEGEPHKGLRINTLKTGVEEFLEKNSFSLGRIPWVENGFYYHAENQPGKPPFHEAGVYYIQEPSAMAPVPFLEVKPGERVLDLCAAPGGKSTQIAEYMQGEGLLVCNEIHPARARILSENIERMGIRNAMVTNESPQNLEKAFPGYFDKILVDAPCSGEGMFRKNEEASTEWSPENVMLCAQRQDEVLASAAEMLRPGGRIVYSTCTFAPAENEGTISRFLKEHKDFSVVKADMPKGFVPGRAEWIKEPATGIENTMRLMPHKIQGEGHFLAVLQKEGAWNENWKRSSAGGQEKGIKEKEYADFVTFEKKYLKGSEFKGIYLLFGEQLYLAPEDMPALKGLKVLRPGLHLGTLKKNRFEPSHALALTLKKEEVVQYVELSVQEAAHYLSGQTFAMEDIRLSSADNPGGWCLVCVEGFSAGWGKLAGNMLKNHYPKGLRKG
ncbi:MAG: RsmB/NOP family class I SAM-dependent RNA methyltransferase [Lachnospiraceae bacterium]